jgi:hypothetical protein
MSYICLNKTNSIAKAAFLIVMNCLLCQQAIVELKGGLNFLKQMNI